MIKVNKPMVNSSGASVSIQFEFDDIVVSFAFDQVGKRMDELSRNYVMVWRGDERICDLCGLPDSDLRLLLSFAALHNSHGLLRTLDSIRGCN